MSLNLWLQVLNITHHDHDKYSLFNIIYGWTLQWKQNDESNRHTFFTQKFQLETHGKINTDINMYYDIQYESVERVKYSKCQKTLMCQEIKDFFERGRGGVLLKTSQ